jgi:hypothetical protein
MSPYTMKTIPTTTLPDESHVEEPASRWSNNPIRDAALRLLNSPAPPQEDPDDIETDPPPAIDPQKVADIPKLGSLDEGIDLFKALNRNIELQQGVGELTERVQKLEYLKKANEAKRCEHIKTNGVQCGSPALGGKEYCFFHGVIHKKERKLPIIEDQRSLHLAYLDLARSVEMQSISVAHGKLLLQILQSAGKNLPEGDWNDGYEGI